MTVDVRELAKTIPDAYAQCKRHRSHDFVEQTAHRVRKGRDSLFEVTERCTHCPTQVITYCNAVTGARLPGRRYVYPEGYLTPGLGDRGTELRDALRLSKLLSMESSSSRKERRSGTTTKGRS